MLIKNDKKKIPNYYELNKEYTVKLEYDTVKAKDFALEDEIVMKKYINEAEEVSFESGFGEAYDKELALKEEYLKDGIEQGSINKAKEIAKEMLNKNMDIKLISELTSLPIEDIKKLEN